MEEIAVLLRSSTTKQRLAGVTGLLEQLRRQNAVPEAAATLITHVLPCLRDHNSKIAMGALSILELLVARVSESTLRSSFKLLWLSVIERLGDNKLQVREKAVDVIVQLSMVLDVSTVFEKLQLCMTHKNWRTREQSLHAIWRCLEQHRLFKERHHELLDDVLRLLEDSSKDVRDAAMTTLEKFYMYIGPSLLSKLQDKSIRARHMATLEDRFNRVLLYTSSHGSFASVEQLPDNAWKSGSAPDGGIPDTLSSLLSSYDLQASSLISSSVARYLESVRNRAMNEAEAAVVADGEQSPLQESSVISKVVQPVDVHETSRDDIFDKEVQKQIGVIYDKLQLDTDWDKRVDGLKLLQELTNRCAKALNSEPAVLSLSQGLRTVRERLCQQVTDLRSSVSREACETIQILAKTLRDEFNAHAEICLGNLLKATYVTIQVISTAADKTIRTMIKSTSNGYTRVIPKLVECAKSRNHVLRYNAVCYLTLALQQWSTSNLSKHTDLFMLILPSILRDALGDVRAQSRKCYWSFHHLFPNEAESVFARLDGSTQRNVKDDPSRFTAKAARQTDYSSIDASVLQSGEVEVVARRSTIASQPPVSASAAFASVTCGDDQSRDTTTFEEVATEKLPRRVLGESSSKVGVDGAEASMQSSRMLAQRPMRVGLATRSKLLVSKDSSAVNELKKTAGVGPLRVRNAPKSFQTRNATGESMYTSRQEPSTAGVHTSSKPVSRVQRVPLAVEGQASPLMELDEGKVLGPKRLPIPFVPSSAASNGPKSNVCLSRVDASDSKQKRAALVKKLSERPKVVPLPPTDQLEEALRNIEHLSWSTRLEAAECIGKALQQSDDQTITVIGGDRKVDGRILVAFIKHLSDGHYRVSHCVLKSFLPLLKLLKDNQLLIPHLKIILSKLFLKFVDIKESVRAIAKEILEHIASTFDSSTLAAIVISMLGDGSNMKVKAAMCHYLRELLPRAEGYMKNGTNNSHMRSFLLKIALLLVGDVPVSVSLACGDLVSVSAQHYSSELEAALILLPPSKRLVVAKALKVRKIVCDFSQKPPLPSALQSTQSQGVGINNNQKTEDHVLKPEKSRKRPKSPNVNSFASIRPNNQKRINTTSKPAMEDQMIDVQTLHPADVQQDSESTINTDPPESTSISSALRSSGESCVSKHRIQLEDILDILEQKNISEVEVKHALYATLHFIKTGSSETWDHCFRRLLFLLLDVATENNVNALKVLQQLVVAQPSRSRLFFDLLLERLLNAIHENQSGVARHLIERILHDVVNQNDDHQSMLFTLITLVSSKSPPELQVVLRLVKLCLQCYEQYYSQDATFVRKHTMVEQLLTVLTKCLNHSSSNVRKNAVDCLVACHFTTMEDHAIVPKFLAAQVDETQQRLVEIFIDRAKMERHHDDGRQADRNINFENRILRSQEVLIVKNTITVLASAHLFLRLRRGVLVCKLENKMVLTTETHYVYPFRWDVVTRAFWNKYPNEHLTHVERVDVLDRHLDEEGRLVTTRLAKVTQANVPTWVRSIVGDSTYVFEETVCDPKLKTLILKSTNLSFRSVATVEETCVYSVHPDCNEKTLYEAKAKVTAFVPLVSQKFERFSVSRGADTATKGIRAVEDICNDIFQGTFQPVFCEDAKDSVGVQTTEKMAATAYKCVEKH